MRTAALTSLLSTLLLLLLCRDLVAILTALEYNQWFTKVSSKDFKLVRSESRA